MQPDWESSFFRTLEDVNPGTLEPETLEIYTPDGQRFRTTVELAEALNQERHRAKRLEAQLRALGGEPG